MEVLDTFKTGKRQTGWTEFELQNFQYKHFRAFLPISTEMILICGLYDPSSNSSYPPALILNLSTHEV